MIIRSTESERRFFIFMMTVVFIFTIIVSRLVFLQIIRGPELRRSSESNKVRYFTVHAPRGRIFDANGEELVSIRPAFVVYFYNDEKNVDNDKTLTKLASVLKMSPTEIKKIVKENSLNLRAFEPVLIKNDIDINTVVKLEESRAELPGVFVDNQSMRKYNFDSLASHILGYVGEINKEELDKLKTDGYSIGEIIGKLGLEKMYDKQLRGVNGARIMEVDASGRPVNSSKPYLQKEAVPGDDIVLTIDARLQKAAEDALESSINRVRREFHNAKTGAVVALDVRTGAILAIASYPDFDPNIFVHGITSNEWAALANDPRHIFNDRAIAATYPPGSLFKVVPASAALELGKITPSTKIKCTGSYTLIDHTFRCWDHGGHGYVNLYSALKMSCDVYFYQVGRMIGPDKMAYYAHQFGLGEISGLGLPGESKGRVPDPAWKKSYFDTKVDQIWYPGETVITAIGQGNSLYSPLQLACMYMAVANGGTLYKPYLVKKVISADGKVIEDSKPIVKRQVDVSAENLAEVRKGLKLVMEPGGTGHSVFVGFPIAVAGKTGTAQNSHGDDHALYAAYAPADNPEIAVVAIIEQGGHGNSAAGPVVREVMDAYFTKGTEVKQIESPFMENDIVIQ